MTANRDSELPIDHRIVVLVGTGGVGKTTLAAALAVDAARRGERTLVITIDPARRLADALGLGSLGNQPRELPAEHRRALGLSGDGQLWAMMLDMKRTFDDLVERFAEGADSRDRILENPIYQHVSDALAGSAEYAAMEKVYELSEEGRFDRIFVDTPPSQHALDFLDAPQRLLEFLDSRLVQLLLHPAFAAGRFGFRLFHGTAQRALRLLERISGLAFLEDISEFLLAFEGMSDGFRTRARSVRALLASPAAGFVLVAGPSPGAARAAAEFLDRLEETGVCLAGVLVNRVRHWPSTTPPPDWFTRGDSAELEDSTQRLATALSPSNPNESRAAARAAIELAKGYASLVSLDAESSRPLRERAQRGGTLFQRIPELPADVHDLEGLAQVAGFLCAQAVPAETPTSTRTEDASKAEDRGE